MSVPLRLMAKPFCHDIRIEQIKRNIKGIPVVDNNEIIHTEKHFHFGVVIKWQDLIGTHSIRFFN